MLLANLLNRIIKNDGFTLVDADGRSHAIGNTAPNARKVTLRLHDKALHRRLALNPKLAFGEAYMDGTMTVDDGSLYDMLTIIGKNYDNVDGAGWAQAAAHRLNQMTRTLQQYNPVGKAQKNVAHHYDLDGTLYDLFLDTDRQYSCAYFATNNDTLEQAQDNKKRHIASKLLLDDAERVLDIGSGWGGLGLYIAKNSKADVTGVTLSEEQHKVSNERAKKEKLDKRVRFKLLDYREEAGSFDRIVSVGMFEHVGTRHYPEFFAKVKELLTEDGVMLLHSIGRMEPPGTTNAWLRKYIFPGGYTPALSETFAAIERSGLYVTDIEILRLHYAETLREWNRRFQANRKKVAEIYDERFCRMWEFYLQSCEVAFRYMNQMVFQIQLAKRQDAVPLTRDYMIDWERGQRVA